MLINPLPTTNLNVRRTPEILAAIRSMFQSEMTGQTEGPPNSIAQVVMNPCFSMRLPPGISKGPDSSIGRRNRLRDDARA
jgi:hypothetical protein